MGAQLPMPEAAMPDVVDCPKPETWQRFARGACATEEASSLNRHLEQCPRCAGELRRLTCLGAEAMHVAGPAKDATSDLTVRLAPEDAVSDQTLALLLHGKVDAEEEPSSEILEQSTMHVSFP